MTHLLQLCVLSLFPYISKYLLYQLYDVCYYDYYYQPLQTIKMSFNSHRQIKKNLMADYCVPHFLSYSALGGSTALHIPAFPSGGCLIDYVPQVCQLLTNKVTYYYLNPSWCCSVFRSRPQGRTHKQATTEILQGKKKAMHVSAKTR